mgnify:CR=1 FL=1
MPKGYSGINKGGRSSKPTKERVFNGELENAILKNYGFGEFYDYEETPEGKKAYDALQRAGVGTIVTVSNSGDKEPDVYRVTMRTPDEGKVLVPLSLRAREWFEEDNNVSVIPLSDRGMIKEYIVPSGDKPYVKLERRKWTEQEAAEHPDIFRAEQRATRYERRQLRIKF